MKSQTLALTSGGLAPQLGDILQQYQDPIIGRHLRHDNLQRGAPNVRASQFHQMSDRTTTTR